MRHGSESDWSEPPLATPRASYKEYDDKALMNTSTQHMQPLGELPSAKMLEATKRPYPHQGKKKGKQVANNGNGTGTGGAGIGGTGIGGTGIGGTGIGGFGVGGSGDSSSVANGDAGIGTEIGGGGAASPSTPVSGSSRATQTAKPRPSPAMMMMVPAPVLVVSPGIFMGSPDSPPANPSTPANGSRPTASAPWLNGNAPNSKTPQGRQRLSMVVDAAIERSAQVGNVDLGRAIKKLYDESLSNGLLADLLDAVLAQKATPEQIHQFQTYVRNARDPNAQSAEPSGTNGHLDSRHHEGRFHEGSHGFLSANGSSTGGVVVKKEKLSKKEKKKIGLLEKHRRGDPGPEDDDTDSDLSSVSSDMFDDHRGANGASTSHHRNRIHSPVNSFTPIQSEYRRGGDFDHPAKRLKLPTFDEIQQDSSIRDPPPIGATRKGGANPRKRPRSHSISTPPPPGSASTSVTPSSSVMAPTSAPALSGAGPILTQPPKKKNKSNKIKIS